MYVCISKTLQWNIHCKSVVGWIELWGVNYTIISVINIPHYYITCHKCDMLSSSVYMVIILWKIKYIATYLVIHTFIVKYINVVYLHREEEMCNLEQENKEYSVSLNASVLFIWGSRLTFCLWYCNVSKALKKILIIKIC